MPPILGTRKIVWRNEAQCEGFAQHMARGPAITTALIELHGPLGAGKTTWVRALLKALGVQGRIKSPTYAVLETYEIAGVEVSHFDFFRFSDPREFEEAGFRDIFSRPGLKLIEWPEKASGQLPAPELRLHIEPGDEDRREVTLQACTAKGLDMLGHLGHLDHLDQDAPPDAQKGPHVD